MLSKNDEEVIALRKAIQISEIQQEGLKDKICEYQIRLRQAAIEADNNEREK